MSVILSKIWLYLGWFYLSLLALSLLFMVRKHHPTLPIFFLVIAVVIALKTSLVQYVPLLSDLHYLGQSEQSIIHQDSLGLDTFISKFLQLHLDPRDLFCVYWYEDTPTMYLISELYPYRLQALDSHSSLQSCHYLISISFKRPQFDPPIMATPNHYLYQVSHHVSP